MDWINAAIAGAAAQAGLPLVDPAAEGWIDATDPSLSDDPDHPDDVEHQIVADHLERELRVTLVR